MPNILNMYTDIYEELNTPKLYSESDLRGIPTEIDETSLLEGEIALREVDIMLEKEILCFKADLYGESVGAIFVAIVGFLKTALTFILKLIFGFKGIVVLILGFIIAKIIKAGKGEKVSLGGGGSAPSASTLKKAGKSLAGSPINMRKLYDMTLEAVKTDAYNLSGRVNSISSSYWKGILTNISANRAKYANDAEFQKAVIDSVTKDIRVDVDENDKSTIVIPKYTAKVVVDMVNEYIREDIRPTGGTYSEILAKNPLQILNLKQIDKLQEVIKESGILYEYENPSLEDFLVEALSRYDDYMLVVVTAQAFILEQLSRFTNDVDNTRYMKLINDLQNSISSRSHESLKKLFNDNADFILSKDKGIELNINMSSDEYYEKTIGSLDRFPKTIKACKDLNKSMKDFATITQVSKIGNSGIEIKDIYNVEDVAALRVEFNKEQRNFEMSFFSKLKAYLEHEALNINDIKNNIKNVEDNGKKVREFLNTFKPDVEELKGEYTKFRALASDCVAATVNLSSAVSMVAKVGVVAYKNYQNPINTAIVHDVVATISALGMAKAVNGGTNE